MRPLRLVAPLALLAASTPALADTLASGAPSDLLEMDDEWVVGIEQPTGMAFLPDGRVVITERAGTVLVRSADGSSIDEAGSIEVGTSFQEKGLLNVAVHPDYADNHIVYFYYTSADNDNRVASMVLDAEGQLDTGSEELFVEGIAAPLNHNGGGLAVLGDHLYIGTGDSGSNSGAHPSQEVVTNYYATCLTNLNGKLLRLNLDGSIPDDNPLVGQTVTACGNSTGTAPSGTSAQPRTEIFAWGFRNAFRVWPDPVTGNLWVGHVGEVTYEMVHVVPPEGAMHAGWPFREGGEGRAPSECQTIEPNVGDCVDPVYKCESSMANPNNPDVPDSCRSMTGGLIFNGCEWPDEIEGLYVFGDYSSSNVWTLQLNEERNDVIAERVEFLSTTAGPVQFVEHEGALYVVAYAGNGHITRIAPQNPDAACGGQTPGGGGAGGAGGSGGASMGGGGQGGSPDGGSMAGSSTGGNPSPSGGNGPAPAGGPGMAGAGGDPVTPPGGGGEPEPGPGPAPTSPGPSPGSAGAGGAGGPAPAGSEPSSSAGAAGADGGTTDDAASDDGCGCRVVGKAKGPELSWLFLAALGLVGAGRRRASSRRG